MRIDPSAVETIAKELYIRALKILPDDIKAGFATLAQRETISKAQGVLATMIRNIAVAEATDNLLCQDTGIPIYNVIIGRNIEIDGPAMKNAIRRGCERATREYPLRSSIVHPLTRKNEHSSCGIGVPVIHIDYAADFEGMRIEMIPKGSGSENNSWLRMAVPAEGVDAIRTFVVDCVLDAGGKTCPPTIVGVGVGGTADLCVHLAKVAATRPLGSHCDDPDGAQLESDLSDAVNMLGVGPQGLGGDATAFAVHVELAATHITMNPVAVNMQCHSARRASAMIDADGVRYGF
jgi:tartrate/fumarate subfamily iron-sulfur-dependent hydro-lyase alpha chain